jgi:DNA-binding SARP family transcriptional activator
MRIALLGPLEVTGPDGPVAVSPGKQRTILAVLALEAGRVVSRDRLLAELWGEAPPATAGKALQVHVSRLRQVLGGAGLLVTRPPGYLLDVVPDAVDVHAFEARVRAAREAPDPAAAAREALAMWRGPPFADLELEGALHDAAPRLEALRLEAQEIAVEAAIAAGRHESALAELAVLVREHPVRENLRGLQMLALYRAGRQAEALAIFREARRVLVDELGIEPGPQLRELHEAILRQDAALSPPPAAPAAAGGFVGRVTELAVLLGALADAEQGHGRLCLVSGEPGIGKSRLVEEVAAQARARGARVLVGRCWEAGGAPAYWPWLQALHDLLPVAGRLPDPPGAAGGDPDGARLRQFDATDRLLRAAAREQPIVLIIDDLHAADEPSLLLLRYLARTMAGAPLLVLAAHRDVDPLPSPQLGEALGELSREPVTRRIELDGLSRDEIGRFLAFASPGLASERLATALHADAGGNPLFVTEIVRLLALEPDHDGLVVPPSVRDVIARRVAHVSDACRRLLALASVLGREFDLDSLQRLADLDEERFSDAVDEAAQARILVAVPGSPRRLRFSHVLIRDTLYDDLGAARRTRLHTRALAALEAEPEPHLAELAHHAVAAGDRPRAFALARRAADDALEHLAYEESARLYRVALDNAPTAGDAELLLALGAAETRAGHTDPAREAFLAAAALARRDGDATTLARAALGYGGRLVWVRAGADPHLIRTLEEGVEAVRGRDAALSSRLMARLAGALRDEPRRSRRDAISAEAVRLARDSGDLGTLLYALDARSSAIGAPDTIGDCLALGEELCQVADRAGDREALMDGLMVRCMAKLQQGRVEEAGRDAERSAEVARDLRQPTLLWEANGVRAMLALAYGRWAEAEDAITEAHELGRGVGRPADTVHVMQRMMLSDFRGDLQAIEPDVRRIAAENPNRPLFRAALAYVHARLGRTPEEPLTRLAEALPFEQEWPLGMSLLAEAAHLTSDVAAASRLYDELTPWAELNVVDQAEGIRGSAERYLGLLAATLGRAEAAARHFDEAVAANERMGFTPWVERTRADRDALASTAR